MLVSAGLVGWLAWRMDWALVGRAFAGLRVELWLAALGVYLLTQLVSALRWRLLARPLGFDRPLSQLVGYYFIGMYFNLLLPTSVGGDVVRAWYLIDGPGKRLRAFLSVFIDRFSGLLVLLGLACVATLFAPSALPAWVPLSVWATAGCAAVGFLTVPLLDRITGRFGRIRRSVDGAREYLGRPRLLLGTTLLSLVVQAANVIVVWLVGCAIGARVPFGYYWILVPMVSLLTLAPVSLNGMGVREGGTALFLAPLGVDASTAVTLAFLWFTVFAAASLGGGAVYLLGHFPRVEERPHEPVGGDSDQGRAGQSQAAA